MKRPIGVWIVLIYCFVCLVGGTYSTIMQATGRPLFPGVELTSLDYLWALLNAAVLLAGAVSLWFLKEEAYMIFCGYFFLLAVGLLWNYFMRGYSSSVGFWAVGSGLIVPAIIYGYCYSLKEKGILR